MKILWEYCLNILKNINKKKISIQFHNNKKIYKKYQKSIDKIWGIGYNKDIKRTEEMKEHLRIGGTVPKQG